MSLLGAMTRFSNRFNNTGPIIVGPSTVSGNFTVTGIATVLGLGVTNNVLVGNGNQRITLLLQMEQIFLTQT